MNEEDFEQKLQALAAGYHRPDPTPAWKSDILARARREAGAAAAKVPRSRLLPPRLLLASWIAIWITIIGLRFSTTGSDRPADPSGIAGSGWLTSPRNQASSPYTLLAVRKLLTSRSEMPW